jgi:glycosyltransferase involved in cell wall biosynthesis
MKKNILFVMNNLNCGGAEKSLISLLETIDYNQYNVDLYLFKHEGMFYNKVPKEVNILPEPEEFKYFDMSFKKAIKECIKLGRVDIGISRIKAGTIFKTEENPAVCEQKVWKCISYCLKKITKKYDIAIGFLEKNPIYFCVDKVIAKRKIGFIHNDYDKLGMNPIFDIKYFKEIDHIVTVSEKCRTVLKERFPMFKNKVDVIYNITSPSIIRKMSLEKGKVKHNGIKIVSLGRLNYQKGFEMAVDACQLLIANGYNIKWYILGEGEEREKLNKLIKDKRLENVIILEGLQENPYPYIRIADVYVQPSRFEGKSIAIDEAKILRKPIVVTNFSTAKDQIIHEENGLIVDMNAEALFSGIKRIIEDESLRKKLVENLSKEELGTESEVEKFYALMK